jgi:phage/plasmid-like protein (TIGR03299 family)
VSTDTIAPAIPYKNRANWLKSGTGVTATSASDVARQAGLDWSVSLHPMTASYLIPGSEQSISVPVVNRQAVIKTTPFGDVTNIGVVGNRYQVFQNGEIFSALDTLIDSGEARYAAAGEYDQGAKVWMLLELPQQISVANDPHAAFILARTSHDGSSSVIIKPIIERLWCHNQINKIFRVNNKFTYTLKHTANSKLQVSEISHILKLSYQNIEAYSDIANHLLQQEVDREHAVNYFKKVFPLPSTIEGKPASLLSVGEKNQLTRANTARHTAMHIYSASETQENIRGTQFGLWQAVVEYADHWKSDKGTTTGVRAMSGGSDNLKLRALELLTN